MIEFCDACKIAYEYYKEAWNVIGLCEAKDLGEKWLFYPQNDAPVFGDSHITVLKDSGQIELFVLPNAANFALLKCGVSIDIPNVFKSELDN